eukprot:2787578-Prymnesium_polylepis.1
MRGRRRTCARLQSHRPTYLVTAAEDELLVASERKDVAAGKAELDISSIMPTRTAAQLRSTRQNSPT